MFEIEILIPVADNDGRAFGAEDHAAFEAYVIDRFGGLSLKETRAQGAWADAGVIFRDETRVYVIAARSITQGHLVAEVVAFAKTHYRQLAIYIRFLGVAEIL